MPVHTRSTPRALCAALGAALALLALTGCVDAVLGACVTVNATTGNSSVCHEGWLLASCSDYDERQVDGGDWTFYPGRTCESLGLPPGGAAP